MQVGRQLNIRLSARARDQLEAVAFLRRTTSSALAREIVTEYLDRHSETPGLAKVLSGLAEHDEADSVGGESVTPLRRRRDAGTSG